MTRASLNFQFNGIIVVSPSGSIVTLEQRPPDQQSITSWTGRKNFTSGSLEVIPGPVTPDGGRNGITYWVLICSTCIIQKNIASALQGIATSL